MSELFDAIVIGGGPAGTHAAAALTEAGANVLMLEGGLESSVPVPDVNAKTFLETRSEDSDQWKTFLGEDFSSIPVGGLEGGLGGGMVSGNRGFALRATAEELPIDVRNGLVMQSLAKGGFGAVWGAACSFYAPGDLRSMGLPADDIEREYGEVSRMIGISGPPTRADLQPPLPLDHHARAIADRAAKKKETLDALRVRIVPPHAAVLTQDMKDRKANPLADMDYYDDRGGSVWRPAFTIDDLLTKSNFHREGNVVVERLEETPDGVVVFGRRIGDRSAVLRRSARRVIVAAGAVNTARILLRTFDLFDDPVPFVAKPHAYTACLHPAMLGLKGDDRRSSLCQLLMIDEEKTAEGFDAGCAQLYGWRSLLLFRLLGSVPLLPVPEATGLLSMLAPALVVADIRFPAIALDGHTLRLRRNDNRVLIACNDDMNDMRRASLKRLHKAMRTVGLMPVKTAAMPPGSTSHHAGTVPIEDGRNLPLSVTPDGKVTRGRNIHVADASMFRSIPALPYTLTIMANARRIGKAVAKTL